MQKLPTNDSQHHSNDRAPNQRTCKLLKTIKLMINMHQQSQTPWLLIKKKKCKDVREQQAPTTTQRLGYSVELLQTTSDAGGTAKVAVKQLQHGVLPILIKYRDATDQEQKCAAIVYYFFRPPTTGAFCCRTKQINLQKKDCSARINSSTLP